MTEIDDLPGFFAQLQQGPPLTDAQREHIRRVQEFERAEMLARIEQVQFFAPILCTCRMFYDRWRGHPTQAECPIHSMMMSHPYTGEPIMPGIPLGSGAFTPAEPHTGDDNDEGTTT